MGSSNLRLNIYRFLLVKNIKFLQLIKPLNIIHINITVLCNQYSLILRFIDMSIIYTRFWYTIQLFQRNFLPYNRIEKHYISIQGPKYQYIPRIRICHTGKWYMFILMEKFLLYMETIISIIQLTFLLLLLLRKKLAIKINFTLL